MDAEFSLEPQEMKQLVKEVNAAYEAIGTVHYGLTSQESTKFRPSLYIVEDMKAGAVITEKNMRSIHPRLGLPPKYYYILLGKKVKYNVKRGTALAWNMV